MGNVTSISSVISIEPLPTRQGGSNDERRLPVRLFHYWDKLRKNRAFPSEDAIESEDLPGIWEHCFLIQVNDLRNRHRADFTYLGSEILKVYHDLLADKDATDFISPNTSHLSQNFWMVIEKKEAIMQSGSFPTSRGNHIKFRQCLLPLGKSDDEVEAIFGCARMKLYL